MAKSNFFLFFFLQLSNFSGKIQLLHEKKGNEFFLKKIKNK